MVKRSIPLTALFALFTLSLGGCKKHEPPPPPPAATIPGEAPPAPPKAPPAVLVGMADPFPHLSSQAAKPFNSGWAAMKAKKYDEAAAAFTEVATAIPDYLGARFQAARAYLLAANPAGTRRELEELVSRNFIAYGGRAGSAKEFALFRTSPEWPAYEQAEAKLRKAYAQGLDHGLVFVARSGSVDAPSFAAAKAPGTSEAKLELKQEAYHYDIDSGRYRPLTATDGRVIAALRSADGKRLAFLAVDKLETKEGRTYFAFPQFGFVDLVTLDTAGPLPLAGAHEELTLGFSELGTPVVSTTGARGGDGLPEGSFEIDTARTGLTKTAAKAAASPQKGERVSVRWNRLWRSDRPLLADATLSEDRHSIQLGGGLGIITSARALSESSLAWSPGQRYFLYAGQLDGCAALKEARAAQPGTQATPADEKNKPAQNELFVYEAERKVATRVDAGPSAFESVWLNDYLFAYENGIGAKATLSLYDLTARKKTTLPLRNGAGLFGLPAPYCAEAAAAPAASAPPGPAAPASAAPAPAAPAAPPASAAPAAPATP